MNSLEEITKKIIETLKAWPDFQYIQVLREFSGKAYAYPTKESRITVGFSELSLEPAGLGGYFGQHQGEGYSGVWADITFCLSIVVPDNKKSCCYQLFGQLCQCLLESSFQVAHISSQGVFQNSSKLSNELVALVKTKAMIGAKQATVPLRNITVKGGVE